MNQVIAPIKIEETSEQVANLQSALLVILPALGFLDFVIPAEEIKAKKAMDGTLKGIHFLRERFPDEYNLDLVVDELMAGLITGLMAKVFTIKGRLTDRNGQGLPNHVVVISEIDIDQNIDLGSAGSNADGSFNFSFIYKPDLQDDDSNTNPDLLFRLSGAFGEVGLMAVLTKEAESVFIIENGIEQKVSHLTESSKSPIVLMNVGHDMEVRIAVGTNAGKLTEFEKLIAQLLPYMRKTAFADLQEDDTHFQISFLSKESGVQKASIEKLKNAFIENRVHDPIPAWAFFGLDSLLLDFSDWPTKSTEELATIITPLQPSTLHEDVKAIAEKLIAYAKNKIHAAKVLDLKTSAGAVLKSIFKDKIELQDDFFNRYAAHEGDIEKFWLDLVENTNFKQLVPSIQLNLQLSQLTMGNVGLIDALQKRGIGATKDLVAIPEQEWIDLATLHPESIPDHIESSAATLDRAKVYANELQTLVELVFPTEVLKNKVASIGVKSFLESNPDFDFTSTPVETFLHKKGEAAFVGIADKQSVTQELRQTQRLYAVTASASDTKVLSGMGYSSAAQIAQMSVTDFAEAVSSNISNDLALLYHAKASHISDSSTATALKIYDATSSPQTHATGANVTLTEDMLPNWRNLFGSIETCECEHCRSVYSPAAYFVDLLHILLGRNQGQARVELFRRRPDLQYMKLSCEHTDTLIPYIDLVNEILETYVAQNEIGTPNAKLHAELSTNDTSSFTESELAANPQHSNQISLSDADAAYDLVSKATFPLTLPFDLHLETGRQFLLGQNSSRYELMTTFGEATSDATIAEGLGLSTKEFSLLVGKKTALSDWDIPTDLFGYPLNTIDLGKKLSPVREFMDRTSIAYTDLIALVNTHFLNGNKSIILAVDINAAPIPINDPKEQEKWAIANACNLEVTRLLHNDANSNATPPKPPSFLTLPELANFNRFIRLWKKLGCTIEELDMLLSALGQQLTPAMLNDLSALWQLIKTKVISIEQACILISNISTSDTNPVYNRLFLNKAILKIDDKFELNSTKTELLNSLDSLQGHTVGLLAAFQISEEELNAIAEVANIDLNQPNTLKLVNLSRIYSHVILAKINQIKIFDLVRLLKFAPHTQWTNTTELLENQSYIEKVKHSGFQASTLSYLFENIVLPGDTLPPKDVIIDKSGYDLKKELTLIDNSTKPEDGIVTADFLKLQLGLLLANKETNTLLSILDGSNVNADPNTLPAITASDIALLNTIPFTTAFNKPIAWNTISVLDSADKRFASLWIEISIQIISTLKNTFINQHIVTTFNTDTSWAALVLSDPAIKKAVLDNNVNQAALTAYKDAHIKIFKCLWLANNLKLTAKELTFFNANSSLFNNFNWSDFTSTQFKAWLQLYDYCTLRDALPNTEKSLISVFETASAGGNIVQAIVDATGFAITDVAFFAKNRLATEFQNEKALIVLQKQILISQTIGVSIEKLEGWSANDLTNPIAKDIKFTLKSKYDEVSWIDVSTEIHNKLRHVQRDALVAYLLHKPEIKNLKAADGTRTIPDTNGLYAYFLIDVEMDACMKTSRLKQAISSVQLFVQRCLMNLEKDTVPPNLIDKEQWKWMFKQTFWTANREVLMHPENVIHSELRDNKTPFFKELESELLQGEVTNESVERAMVNYLYKLEEVARLDICGMYEDTDAQELHVFGRTFNSPPQYFYRKRNLQTQEWTAWEKVQLDIQGNEEGESAGVHLIPVVWNRRLYLFWPIFTEKIDKEMQAAEFKERHDEWISLHNMWLIEKKKNIEINKEIDRKNAFSADNSNSTGFIPIDIALDFVDSIVSIKPKNENNNSKIPHVELLFEEPKEPKLGDKTWEYWDVNMAYSEYNQNKWSAKKVSKVSIKGIRNNNGPNRREDHRFLVETGSELKINVFYNPWMLLSLGAFEMSCSGKMIVVEDSEDPTRIEVINPKQSNFYQGILSVINSGRKLNWGIDDSIPLVLIDNNVNRKSILSGSNKEYGLHFSSDHDFKINSKSKFFYQDQKRNYFVQPGDKIDNSINSLKQPSKAEDAIKHPNKAMVHVNRKKIQIFKEKDKGDPTPMQVGGLNIKFLPSEITDLVDSNQISINQGLVLSANQKVLMPPIIPINLASPTMMISDKFLKPIKKLEFQPFFHAYICNYIKALNQYGIEGLLNLSNQGLNDKQYFKKPSSNPLGSNFVISNNFVQNYQPNDDHVSEPYPMEDVDFSSSGAYSMYNWELFFHVPMLIANRLSKNQKFEEAMRWYHFIFNPTTNDPLADVSRYWQVMPLRNTKAEMIEAMMQHLNNPVGDAKRKELETLIEAWRKDPFNPHHIAQMRLEAYQKNVVMKYLDNIIAWADNLFQQDSIESINQATQLYIMVSCILGKGVENVPSRGTIKVKNYTELEAAKLNALSNAQVQMETTFPFFNLQNVSSSSGGGTSAILSSVVPAEYFGIPNNPKLLAYWDIVADRLFKIRHCQNIEGEERELALFEPRIDPDLLVRATALGIDISSVLADINAPMPHYRFAYILQKALEICGELKSMGSSLLSALEKNDNEALTLMRTQQETTLLNLVKTVKQLQKKETQRNSEGLEKTKEVTSHRAEYYEKLFKSGLNSSEKEHGELTAISMILSVSGQYLEMAASSAHIIPDVEVGVILGPTGGATNNNKVSGGDKTGPALSAFARYFGMLSSMTSYSANAALTNAGYQRRSDDWKQQSELAVKELKQIEKQILAAQIREQIAERDLRNHEQQIDNARQVEEFYRNKYTQEELYGWMQGEISTLYFQCYQLAYDLAKKAEKTYRFELGIEQSNFIQFGNWDSFRKGLLCGEKLFLQLKQLEKAHMDQNKTEHEVTKNISLAQLDPLALIRLRANGIVDFDIPEVLYNLDFPSHYFRRIKSVSISIPSIAGPYTSVNAQLFLTKSSFTKKPKVNPVADEVVSTFGAIQSIATSHAQNDSGLFELNLKDSKYLPFEYSGAVSSWRLSQNDLYTDPKVGKKYIRKTTN